MKKIVYLVLMAAVAVLAFKLGSRENNKPAGEQASTLGAEFETGERNPGTFRVSPERQQTAGIMTGTVEKGVLKHPIRSPGRVLPDENRIYRIISPTEGWIVDLQGGTTGSLVRKDQLLCKISGRDIFNRDIISAQQAYFLALNTLDRKQAENAPEDQMVVTRQQVSVAERNLQAIGLGEAQIQELEKTRKPVRDIEVRSPVTGFVLSRNASPHLRFDRNVELYRIADLSRVWILADVYEQEAEFFKPGARARVSLVHLKKSFEARVSAVLPLFDGSTRTLKVRLEVDNPGHTMRPDMFVDVEFPIELPPILTVPMDALMDSGLKKTIFVDRGQGYFEPREVRTGRRLGTRVEILEGLNSGERIALSGTFLLDSESRMELAAAGLNSLLAKDPVTGADVSTRKAEKLGLKSLLRGQTYYFSSQESLSRFEQNPAAYAGKPTGISGEPENRHPGLKKEAPPGQGMSKGHH